LISRRVRQLNAGGGAISHPLVADTGNLGGGGHRAARNYRGKMGWEMPELVVLTRPVGKKRKQHY
jgi:hypothetical protein